MPISTDNTRLSIDFGWDHIFKTGEKVHYQLKFYHAEHGGMVQIGNGIYEPYEVPVEMFTEVAEFLIAQGVIKGSPLKTGQTGQTGLKTGGTVGLPPLPRRGTIMGEKKAEPVQALMTQEEEKVDPAHNTKDDDMLKQRMAAKAAAVASGGKNKLRKDVVPDPNPPKERPKKVILPDE
jgi:hypothetical protein